MKQIIILSILLISFSISAQDRIDSLKEQIETHDQKIIGLEERLGTDESDLSKLKAIKLSGYIQSQFDVYESDVVKSKGAHSTFYIRRARLKLTYQATDGIKLVLQPDYSTGNLSLKDAFVVVGLPKLRSLALSVGQFNRPNYEVEYSSSSREVLERSKLVKTIYPGEREIGAKLEFQPVKVPIKLQFAVLNGNFTGSEAKDVDSKKDLMGRAVYSFKFPMAGIGIDLGAHGYYGGLRALNKYVENFQGVLDSTSFENYHTYLDKKWIGGEIQAYIDFLGGMAIKGEFIQGKNAFLKTTSAINSKGNPYKIRNFSGYYVYLVKNIGEKNQLVAKYDFFDPNTNVSGDEILDASDLKCKTLTLSWQYYLNENIRLSAQYEIPKNETNTLNPEDLEDNTFSLRFQAKF